jgi:hypothetical protein
MKKLNVLLCLGTFAAFSNGQAADFKQSKVTQVVNDVQIISAADQKQSPAAVNDTFAMPDILRTGDASRAELIAADDTVTRVGANTIFSFDKANRTIDLKQGSLLFHSPHGKGGGSIHTGSATASVLGSTLIVSATKNGGFKVIPLEDGADIKLPNGQHQHLNPGQMTFILPGGSHLAPIVLFRMDDLIMNSQLVNGFQHPLSSQPLIQNEIANQNKLIKSGKLTDTGLQVGDNATADQVEVLDQNTVQSHVGGRGVQAALNSDATINTSSLKDSKIPTPPTRIFLKPAFALAGNSFFAGQTFQGFAARNLAFNTPGANPGALTVDLSPYVAQPVFDFVAAKNLNFAGSVTFSGLAPASTLSLIAGESITFAPHITLTANYADFEIATAGALSADGLFIYNNVGTVGIASGSEISLNNFAILNQGQMILTAPNAIDLTWDADGHLGELSPGGDNILTTDAGSGEVTINAKGGPLSVEATSIQAHYLTLNSGDSILLDCAGHTLTATGAGATANITAPNVVTVKNTDLSNFGVVNMAANTIVLKNVDFGAGSIDTLTSGNHMLAANPNTDHSIIPGEVNFIHGVTYGGTLVTAPSGFVNGTIPGTGIVIQ